MQYVNGNIYFFTYNNMNSSILMIATSSQMLNIELSVSPIEGVIELFGVIVVYGGDSYSLVQLQNINNILEPKLITTEKFSNTNNNNSIITNILTKSMVYYPDNKLFIAGHSNGELSAWNPGNNNLVKLENIKIADTVRKL